MDRRQYSPTFPDRNPSKKPNYSLFVESALSRPFVREGRTTERPHAQVLSQDENEPKTKGFFFQNILKRTSKHLSKSRGNVDKTKRREAATNERVLKALKNKTETIVGSPTLAKVKRTGSYLKARMRSGRLLSVSSLNRCKIDSSPEDTRLPLIGRPQILRQNPLQKYSRSHSKPISPLVMPQLAINKQETDFVTVESITPPIVEISPKDVEVRPPKITLTKRNKSSTDRSIRSKKVEGSFEPLNL